MVNNAANLNLTDFTYLLNRPDAVNDKQTDALDRIVHEFPYLQSARALRLKGLYNQNSFQYNYALKVTAAYTTDRSVLFDFITSDTFTAIHKGLYEQKLAELYNIDVMESEVVTKDSGLSTAEKVELSILTSIKESAIPFVEEDVEEVATVVIPEALPEEATPKESAAAELPEIHQIDITASESAENEIPEVVIEGQEIEFVPVSSETKLDIGKPIEFSKDEKHSFQEWLQLSQIQPIDRSEPQPISEVKNIEEAERTKKSNIIDRFIEASPKIPPVRDFKPAETPEPYKEDNSALMTETLARVYLEQRKYTKAIQAYEILILKYPEKSIFFADRIAEIKNIQQNNI